MKGDIVEELADLAERIVGLCRSRQWEEAVELGKRRCDLCREELGESHGLFARVLIDLASLYVMMSDYDSAEPLYRRALAVQREAVGGGDVQLAATLDKLAFVHGAQGHHDKAAPLHREAISIRLDDQCQSARAMRTQAGAGTRGGLLPATGAAEVPPGSQASGVPSLQSLPEYPWAVGQRGSVFSGLARRLRSWTRVFGVSDSATDVVECTVYAPPAVAQGRSAFVQVFAHTLDQIGAAAQFATDFDAKATRRGFSRLSKKISRNTQLQYHLTLPGLVVDEPVQGLVWRGLAESVQFGVYVPGTCAVGDVVGSLHVSLNGMPVGSLKFILAVEAATEERAPQSPEPASVAGGAYRSAFIAYAEEDRGEAIRRSQVLSRLGIKCFFDTSELGDKRRNSIIDKSDLFMLFWSHAAHNSERVLKSVQYVADRKEHDALSPPEIVPVVIDSSSILKLPRRLMDFCLDDYLLQLELSGRENLCSATVRTPGGTGHAVQSKETRQVGEDRRLDCRIGNYTTTTLLGVGGFGRVYKAKDEMLDRCVAVKFLTNVSADSVARFHDEARALAMLGRHPAVVQIYSWGEYEGENYFALEYMENSLDKRLKEHAEGLPLAEVVTICASIADALVFAHDQGILHRDIKPANILVESVFGQAKLADFGLVKFFEPEGAEASAIAGTPCYMSPEQLVGGTLNGQSDVFSLGATMYELLTGNKPFEGNTIAALRLAIKEKRRVPLRECRTDVRKDIEDIVDSALQYRTADRFSSAGDMAAALRRGLAELPAEACGPR